MRVLVAAVVLSLVSSAADENQNLPVISPADVGKHVNRKCIVEMQIKSIGKSNDGKLMFLNSEDSYRDAGNFGIVIDAGVSEKFKEAKISDLRSHFTNKRVRVTGTITLYKERPQIRLDEINQIQLVDKK
jgi:DNA/RNA endonuclease YhcR with UshA esterase domain